MRVVDGEGECAGSVRVVLDGCAPPHPVNVDKPAVLPPGLMRPSPLSWHIRHVYDLKPALRG